MISFDRILLGTYSKAVPRQLLQSSKVPFFRNLTMIPCVQSSGIFFSFPIFLLGVVGGSAASTGSALSSSALRLSWPKTFLLFFNEGSNLMLARWLYSDV